MNIQEIIDAFGSFYIKEQNNMNRLVQKMMQGSQTLNLKGIRHIKTEETLYRTSNVETSEMIQPYQESFTPKGNVQFHPNQIPLRPMKVDKQLQPNKIRECWLGFLSDDNKHPKDYPLVKYMMEQLIAKQVENDRELKLVYKGVYAEPTEGTAGDAVNSMDGFKKILTAAAAPSHVYPIHRVPEIGVLNKDEIFDQVEAFDEAIPEFLTNVKMYIFMSPSMKRAYFRKLRELGYYNVASAEGLSFTVDNTAHEIIGLPSMTGTTDIWATLPQNILHLTKRSKSNFDVQANHRNVDILGDWFEGVGFEDNDLVFASCETVGWNNAGTALAE